MERSRGTNKVWYGVWEMVQLREKMRWSHGGEGEERRQIATCACGCGGLDRRMIGDELDGQLDSWNYGLLDRLGELSENISDEDSGGPAEMRVRRGDLERNCSVR